MPRVYSSARRTSTLSASATAFASFSFTSACVLPRTFLISRLPVFSSYPAVYRPSQRQSLRFRIFPSPFARFFAMSAPPSLVAQTTTTEVAQSLLIFLEDRIIFYSVPRASEISILCLLRRSFYAISDIEIQFLRKLRTVKTVLFLAAKRAGKRVRRSFHNADPAACRLPVNHSFGPLPTEVCAIPGLFRLWPAFQSR